MMPRWVAMWAIAFALYGVCKGATYWQVHTQFGERGRGRRLGYLLAWPGMDASAFLSRTNARPEPTSRGEWVIAVLKVVLGFALTWVVAPWAWPARPLVAGWIGMVGAIFILHFGVFHLLSLAWRHAGIDAVPLMRSPMRATSLGEFWGRRWNTGFHELANRFTFTPLRSSMGVVAAMLTTFVASGLIHELVISVPAALVTLYVAAFLFMVTALLAAFAAGELHRASLSKVLFDSWNLAIAGLTWTGFVVVLGPVAFLNHLWISRIGHGGAPIDASRTP
jgi:Membrane bound O-acyl transferase family